MSGFSLWSRLRNTSIIYGSRVLTSINYGSNTWMLKFDKIQYPIVPLSEALIPSGLRGAPRRDSTSSREPPVRSKRVLAKAALTPLASKTGNIYIHARLNLRLYRRKGAIKEDKTGSHIREYIRLFLSGSSNIYILVPVISLFYLFLLFTLLSQLLI